MMRLAPCAFAAFLIFLGSPAIAACPDRVAISRGDTLSAIAAACGINVETLMAANPGLRPNRLQPGAIVAVPAAPLPTIQRPYGHQRVPVAPPITRTAPGIDMPTNIYGREYRTERPIYIDPTREPLPGQLPMPGQPGSPGFPLPLR